MKYQSFAEFYPFYLNEHKNPMCRLLHVVGISAGLTWLLGSLLTANWSLAPIGLVIGYGFAWVGHFFFEKNRPATFKYPLYSFRGDFCMVGEILTGRRKLKGP